MIDVQNRINEIYGRINEINNRFNKNDSLKTDFKETLADVQEKIYKERRRRRNNDFKSENRYGRG